MDSCCLSLCPGIRGLFSVTCIEGSSLDTRWILGAVVRRLSRGKYIILCESRGQWAMGACFLVTAHLLNLATAFLR